MSNDDVFNGGDPMVMRGELANCFLRVLPDKSPFKGNVNLVFNPVL